MRDTLYVLMFLSSSFKLYQVLNLQHHHVFSHTFDEGGGATKRFMGVLRVTRVLVHHTLSAAVPEMKKIFEHQEIFARELAYLHHSPSPHQLITKLTSSYSSTTAFITLRGPSLTSPTSGLPPRNLQAGNLNLWVRLGVQRQSPQIIKRKLMA